MKPNDIAWTARLLMVFGALSGGTTVMLGAFGAHGLEGMLTADALDTYNTAVQYQGLHALALFACGLLAMHHGGIGLRIAGSAFLVGTLLFSGSLYLLVLTDIHWLGMITPFGGLSFIIGWFALAAAGWSATRYD